MGVDRAAAHVVVAVLLVEEVAGQPEPRLVLELVAERAVVAVTAHDQPARSGGRRHQC